MRFVHIFLATTALAACTATSLATARPTLHPESAAVSCAARTEAADVDWRVSVAADAVQLSRWCRAVGAPVLAPTGVSESVLPALDDVTIVSWNAHLAEGDLDGLIRKLRAGDLTAGRPVQHFVLLVQELYRRGDAVPEFDAGDRSAFAIRPRDPQSLDIDDHAARLGLSLIYVPSMRNGPELREDRGNAILSTEPLLDPLALELPLARQRRVVLGAAVMVQTSDGPRRLEVINAHLEPVSSPKSLWVLRNPRGGQMRAILDLLSDQRYADQSSLAGVVLGGDLNTVRSGANEEAYRLARAWSHGLVREDPRATHMMGRLDYLFVKLTGGWTASTRRLEERFGSDHFPVLGTFSR